MRPIHLIHKVAPEVKGLRSICDKFTNKETRGRDVVGCGKVGVLRDLFWTDGCLRDGHTDTRPSKIAPASIPIPT